LLVVADVIGSPGRLPRLPPTFDEMAAALIAGTSARSK
jgi:hypothetical protein